ncbi:MAG: hypothetical protein SAK29_21615 [Scytonema sp. PMC 1069.18]|nr:hypothetical protein [Scytonema sp. PMC 1069.18]MEC4884459.1 hypothetical protein [Scytonema sp. PMC 1070.18]
MPGWLIRLLIVASLVTPPTLVAAFSKDAVFFYFRAWGIEYQFRKEGTQTPPHQW